MLEVFVEDSPSHHHLPTHTEEEAWGLEKGRFSLSLILLLGELIVLVPESPGLENAVTSIGRAI